MFTATVCISSLENAKKFINMTSKYDGINMRLKMGNYEVNAHSVVGVLSMVDSEKNAVFTADIPNNDAQMTEDIKPFEVK